jgi:DNA invertase Pin-like site-specific DNA recombinase
MRPIDIYLRISQVDGRAVTDPAGEATRQEEACRAKLRDLGLRAGQVHRDLDVSGGKLLRERRHARAMMERVDAGTAGGFIVAYGSREARNMIDGEEIIALGQSGVTVIFADAPAIDWNNPAEVAMYRMRMVFQTMEREAKGKQMAASRDRALDRGVYPGRTPHGFTKNPDRTLAKNAVAEVIEAAYRRRIGGGSWSAVAHVLTDGGVGGRAWTITEARNLIMRPIYRGEIGVKSNGEPVVIPSVAIVTPSEWKKAQPTKGRLGRPDGGKALLSKGLLRCGGCGRALVANRTTLQLASGDVKVYGYYTCRSGSAKCQHPARVGMEEAEEYLLGLAREVFMAKPGGYHAGRDADPERLTELEAAVEAAKRQTAIRLKAAGIQPTDALVAQAEPVVAAQAELDEEVTARREALDPAAVIRKLDEATIEERRKLIEITLGQTTVIRDPAGPRMEDRLANLHVGVVMIAEDVAA